MHGYVSIRHLRVRLVAIEKRLKCSHYVYLPSMENKPFMLESLKCLSMSNDLLYTLGLSLSKVSITVGEDTTRRRIGPMYI
jgi:hypothetical protein